MPGIRNKSHNEMMNILSQFCMTQMGFGPVGEIRMLTKGSGNAWAYYRDRINEANMHTTIAKAEAAMVTQRNDVLLVTPDSHSWYGDDNVLGAELTWDKQNTHVLGLDPGSLGGYQRARFAEGASGAAIRMTVSGNANTFKNLRWMHGAGSAAEVRIMTISGAGNVFDSCCFASPIDQTQADSANFRGMTVSGSQNHFKHCLFGTQNAIHRNSASCMLELSGGGMNVFENCIFRSRSAATTPYFILHSNTGTGGNVTAVFINCHFINVSTLAGSYDLTIAISNTAAGTHYLYFDSNCTFSGVTDIVTSGQEAKIYIGGSLDASVLGDRKKIGKAVAPVAQ